MFDPALPRWIKASIATYAKSAVPQYPLYLNSYSGADQDWAELRLDGPLTEEYELASFKIDITVDILITAFCGTDEYTIDRMTGAFGSALNNDICLYKYGPGPQDDKSMFGRLQIDRSKTRKVDITQFGLITPQSKFKRAAVEAMYTCWL